jgi:hypothetical protein
LKKDVEPIIKNQNKLCFSEPRERKSGIKDYECEMQTIYHHSTVDAHARQPIQVLSLINLTVDKGRTSKAPNHQLMEQFVCFRRQIRKS